MQITALQSNHFGHGTYPHYIKLKKEESGVFTIDVLFLESNPLNTDQFVSLNTPVMNTHIYKIVQVAGSRKAKGDWTNHPEPPSWCQISAKFNGYYNPETDSCSATVIKQK